MKSFLARFAALILSVLSGFDRLRFRGDSRLLNHISGVHSYLWQQRILHKDFPKHAQELTGQLRRLTEAALDAHITIQVLPFGEGWHPGTTGSFQILEFPEEVHSPVAYIVSQAGDVYLEREDDMRRVTLTFTHLQTAALSQAKSRDLIAAIARDLA